MSFGGNSFQWKINVAMRTLPHLLSSALLFLLCSARHFLLCSARHFLLCSALPSVCSAFPYFLTFFLPSFLPSVCFCFLPSSVFRLLCSHSSYSSFLPLSALLSALCSARWGCLPFCRKKSPPFPPSKNSRHFFKNFTLPLIFNTTLTHI